MVKYALSFPDVMAYFQCLNREVPTIVNGRQQQILLIAHNCKIFYIPFSFENGILKCYPKPLFFVSPWHLDIGQFSTINITLPLRFKLKTLFEFLTRNSMASSGLESRWYISDLKSTSVLLECDILCSKSRHEIEITENWLTKQIYLVWEQNALEEDFL